MSKRMTQRAPRVLMGLQSLGHGAPHVDLADVPKHLHPTKAQQKKFKNLGDTDPKFFERFDWVLDEMIWAFTQKIVEDDTAEFYDHTESNKEPDLMKSIEKLKVDRDGLKAHEDRKQNGYRLFGKYFQTLWT